MWTGKRESTGSSDWFGIGLNDGYLHFAYNLGSGEVNIVYNVTRIDDGQWHQIYITRYKREASVRIDNSIAVKGISPGSQSQLNINSGLFLGI
jgi:hypothetical protein